jgi:probable addiction module antidote protein
MPKRTGDYHTWLLGKLSDRVHAANFLNAALQDSSELFLACVKDVIEAGTVSEVAQKAGVTRESIYRSFSATGNPTFETLTSVLAALGLKLQITAVPEQFL